VVGAFTEVGIVLRRAMEGSSGEQPVAILTSSDDESSACTTQRGWLWMPNYSD